MDEKYTLTPVEDEKPYDLTPVESEGVPDSFLHRLATGGILGRILTNTKPIDVHEGTPTGLSDENLQRMIDLGVFHDPATGRPGALQTFNETTIMGLAKMAQALGQGLDAGVQGLGNMAAQIHEEFGGSPNEVAKTRREAMSMVEWKMIDSAAGGLARPHMGPEGATDQVIGKLPKSEDFENRWLNRDAIPADNLRDLWQERGIHPEEAIYDASQDAFKAHDLINRPYDRPDRSGVAPTLNSPLAEGTPRAALAKTGEAHIDTVLEHPILRDVINDPIIDRDHAIPNSWGGSTPLENPVTYLDHEFPHSLTVDGVTFDPAIGAVVHENVEEFVMMKLMESGMDREAALRAAYWGWGNPAEHAAYRALGMDPAHVEEALKPFLDRIASRKAQTREIPPDLFKETYPGGNPLKDVAGEIEKPSAGELAKAKEIMAGAEGEIRSLSAAASDLPPDVPLSVQPPMPPGQLAAAFTGAINKLYDIGRNIQMLTAPMAVGSVEARAAAKDFANALRRNRWEWSRYDADLEKTFTPEQRKRMWDAADEESVARQLGESREHQGLITLEPAERAAVEDAQTRAQLAWARARDLGMVEGEGLPSYTPRMVLNIATAVKGDGPIAINSLGRNLRTRTAQMLHRQHLTAEETEAAAKALLGDEATLVRDIRTLPLATAKLEDAIAGRTLVNQIKDIGARTGAEAVSEGVNPGAGWFTIDHPALKTWRTFTDDTGTTVTMQVPLYIRSDFEGILRAVLSQPSGALYGGAMALKGKIMSLIMNSPLIHNAVEWGRALPAMPGKVATFKVYFEGNRIKNDVGQMREAIDAGLVPIGKRFFNQDLDSIMEQPSLTAGRSWTSQILAAVPGLFDEAAGTAVKRAIDKAGDFWHNTLLWDRIADLQAGLYANFRDELLSKGVDRQTATVAAAHWANRFAGALPREAMSDAATKTANMLLFSRTFTMGNLGIMKDMLTGMPRDVMAQLERNMGEVNPEAVGYAKSLARRRAIAVVAADIGLFYVGNSILQSALNVLTGDSTLDKEMHGYAQRFSEALQKRAEHPLSLLQPFDFLQSVSATSQNEPGKQDRLKIGNAADGTAIYLRNPAGKIGEEFLGYLTGPFDMLRRKMGTVARPAWQILSNDKGFGRKIYDPNADMPEKYLSNAAAIAMHLAGAQTPEGQIRSATDLIKGDGDPKLNAMGTFGPVAGLTVSKGAPGGPAVGELYHAREMHQYAVDAALPDIRKQIQRGDITGAQSRMTELGIPAGLQRFYVRTTMNPATRLNGRTMRDFYYYATPEQRERMERAR